MTWLDRRTPLSKREGNQILPSETGAQHGPTCSMACGLINPSSLVMTDAPPLRYHFSRKHAERTQKDDRRNS